MGNPFFLIPVPADQPLCDRERELIDLSAHARACASVVLYSPRRYGKTSLVRRLQTQLAAEGAVTAYCDFFAVASVEDAAARLARSVFAALHGRAPLWKRALSSLRVFRPVLRPDPQGGIALSVEAAAGRSGLELLREMMESLSAFIAETEETTHLAIDEFQEIVALREARSVEAELRSSISQMRAAWLFVGSRRHLLLGIFNEQQRPFFQSAILYPLSPLRTEDLAGYVSARCRDSGQPCSAEAADRVATLAQGHPYHAQRLGYFAWEIARRHGCGIEEATVDAALDELLLAETPLYEAVISGLTPHNRLLLRAIARESTPQLLSAPYVERHRLGSVGGVQRSARTLVDLDLVERADGDMPWRLTDPMLGRWLNRRGEERLA